MEVETWAAAEVQRWTSNGYCRPASPAEQAAARWQSASFVTNISTKPRLVVDLSPQNASLHDRCFKYENLPTFVSMLKRGDHAASWDISDAFHHIRLAPEERIRLAFRVAGTLYLPLTLPFGLKLAPWALTKLLRPVIQHLRSLGYIVLPYMDDFAISVDQPETVTCAQATAARAYAVDVFTRLGLHVHPEKGSPRGTTRLEMLGFVIDTTRSLLVLTPKRQHKLVGAAHSIMGAAARDRRWVRTRALQRFCGIAASASLAIPLARHRLRSLFSAMRTSQPRSRLTSAATRDLVWWSALHSTAGVGRTLWETQTVMRLDTDASSTGWGALRDSTTPARGFFDLSTSHHHINRKELLAIIYALQSWPSVRGPGVVRVRTDSRVVMSIINSLCSRSPALHHDVTRLRRILNDRGLGIEATWLASLENKWADRLSREPDSSSWTLQRDAWRHLNDAWGPLTIDRFASTIDTHLPRFNAATACPGVEAVDAYKQCWTGERNYCFPPFSQAAVALRHCYEQRATAVFILPVWPAQPWWHRAISRANSSVLLPRRAVVCRRSSHTALGSPPSSQMAALLFQHGGRPPTAPAGASWPPTQPWPISVTPAPAPPPRRSS